MYQSVFQQGNNDNKIEDQTYATAMYQTRLPQALERVLLNKEKRLEHSEELYQEPSTTPQPEDTISSSDEHQARPHPSKQKVRKRRRKKSKKAKISAPPPQPVSAPEVDIEYLDEEVKFDVNDPNYMDYTRIFEAFKIAEERSRSNRAVVRHDSNAVKDESMNVVPLKARGAYAQLEVEKEAAENAVKPKLSKKQWKKLNRYTVSELKQLVDRPDLVEMQDVTATDPKLLIFLKSYRNTVKVPRHWCFKRKYLQGKRGFEKTPFVLPDYIRATGIMELRGAVQEKDAHKGLKSKMRDKIRPKLGKLDIDYARLHDAFFKWQTKPSRMTGHGDIYYESKEFETKLMEKKPGNLSEELRMALGMPLGPDSHKFPPPWLIAMQRYGPPPSYPNMRIPGLNAPIPEGCTFGYHAGGWGKPPVDATGKPLYGDVFAVYQMHLPEIEEEAVDRTRWGQMEEGSESEYSSEEEEVEMEQEYIPPTGLETPTEGFITPSGTASCPVGVETPEVIELRKKKIKDYMDSGEAQPLFHVLPQKKTTIGSAIMGSMHVYDVSQAINKSDAIVDEKVKESPFSSEQMSKNKSGEKAKSSSTSKKLKDFKF